MTWFKVDDGLHSHPKVLKAGVEAMGLWVLAGSWCADNGTDGWIPDYAVMRIDPVHGKERAAILTSVRLWIPGERDGDRGWTFHQWNEPGRQPTREQVLAERAASAERQRRGRERARERRERESQERDFVGSNGMRYAVTPPVTNGVSHASVTPVVTGVPTRPDPTRPEVPSELLKKQPLVCEAEDPVADENPTRGSEDPPPGRYDWRTDLEHALANPAPKGTLARLRREAAERAAAARAEGS